MNCQRCGKEQADRETFYTDHADGKIVCADCLPNFPKSLHEIQAERKKQYNVGDTISFKYRSRSVKCIVERIEPSYIVGKLLTAYIGKNEEWEAGESKSFFKKSIK